MIGSSSIHKIIENHYLYSYNDTKLNDIQINDYLRTLPGAEVVRVDCKPEQT